MATNKIPMNIVVRQMHNDENTSTSPSVFTIFFDECIEVTGKFSIFAA